MTGPDGLGKPRRRLHGRRRGKPLSARREGLIADLLPRLLLDLAVPAPPSLEPLFPNALETFRVEIGFGGGEHLVAEALRNPATGFFGVEPFRNGLAKILDAIAEREIGNVRLHAGDAAELLDWLPAASLARIDLLYPDPWPKKRHWKRRFVSDANLDRMARVLRPGGEFRFASDIAGYVEWTLAHVAARSDFEWRARRPGDWREPWAGWSGTRYEAKALREGRRPSYLTFRRR